MPAWAPVPTALPATLAVGAVLAVNGPEPAELVDAHPKRRPQRPQLTLKKSSPAHGRHEHAGPVWPRKLRPRRSPSLTAAAASHRRATGGVRRALRRAFARRSARLSRLRSASRAGRVVPRWFAIAASENPAMCNTQIRRWRSVSRPDRAGVFGGRGRPCGSARRFDGATPDEAQAPCRRATRDSRGIYSSNADPILPGRRYPRG